jgi:hypothetical protein
MMLIDEQIELFDRNGFLVDQNLSEWPIDV